MKIQVIFLILIFVILAPIESFGILDTHITIKIHSSYNIGEEMIVMGKLVDSVNRSLQFVNVKVYESNDLIIIDDSNFLGMGTTDARGEFRVPVTVQDWDGDKTGEIYAVYEGSDAHNPTSSEIKSITITNYTPVGKEFEYEAIKEQEQSSNDGGCLIATASYGTELSDEVQNLRSIRNTMYETKLGGHFMHQVNDFYYSFSPTVADMERENPIFREMVRLTITPSMMSFSILDYKQINSEEGLIAYVLAIGSLNIGMYVGVPAIMIMRISQKLRGKNQENLPENYANEEW